MKLLSRLTPTRAQLFTVTLIASAMGLSVAAVSLPHQFTSGTPASAAQVNANFAALKTAVDGLQTQAAADAAKITALEGKLAPLGANLPLASKRGVMAYVWVNDPGNTTAYTPDVTYSYSSTGGAITVQKVATGAYNVTFNALGANVFLGGNVQVSGYASDTTCNVNGWGPGATNNDVLVQVQCKNGNVPADSLFTALFVS